MMAEQTSSGSVEGGASNDDELKQFFEQNAKLKQEWYHTLQQKDIDYELLMETREDGIREMLKEECNFNSIAINKLIVAIAKDSRSAIYKYRQSTKISIVSTEEHAASENIQKEAVRVSEEMKNVSEMIEKLQQNYTASQQHIQKAFDEIAKAANRRRSVLLQQLESVRKSEHEKLCHRQNMLQQKANALNKAYEDTQNLMKDIQMEAQKRKNKIISTSQQILTDDNERKEAQEDAEKLSVRLDVASVNEMISNIGSDALVDVARMKAQMVFGSYGLDTSYIQIVHDAQVKCVKDGARFSYNHRQLGKRQFGPLQTQRRPIENLLHDRPQRPIVDLYKSARVKWAMPTKSNNPSNIKTISFQCSLRSEQQPSCVNFIGVVSNRTTEMISAWNGLKDAFGICSERSFVHKGNQENPKRWTFVKDNKYKGFRSGDAIRARYDVQSSKLTFYAKSGAEEIYTMELWQAKDITSWYPCVSLRYPNDTWTLNDVVIE